MELFYDSTFWELIAMMVLIGFAVKYFFNPVTAAAPPFMTWKLKEGQEHAVMLQDVFDTLGRTIRSLDERLRKQLEAVESKVVQLTADIGLVRHETHAVEKHAAKLAVTTDAFATKLGVVEHNVDAEVSRLKQIGAQVKDSVGLTGSNAQQIDRLTHEVHHLEREAHRIELQRIDSRLKAGMTRVVRNTRHINDIEQGLRWFELHDAEHHGHNGNGHYDGRSRAIAELESADRKIENLMDETIQIEAGYLGHYARALNSIPALNGIPSQEYEEHHRKLIDTAQHIFRDVKKYLTPAAVKDMEVEGEQVDWSRGELFANPTNLEAARAYHQQVKDYFIKLKEAVTSSLHELAAQAKPHRSLSYMGP
jgi:hypothetical protein